MRKFRFSVLTCELGSKALVSVGEDVHVLVVVPRSGGNQGDNGGGDKGHSEAKKGWIKKGNPIFFRMMVVVTGVNGIDFCEAV